MKIVIIEKTGIIKTQNVKNFEIDNLYKKCLFRKADDFAKRHTWTVKIGNKTYNVSLFAKTKGKATTENKYDLPPPIDSTMYYGSMAIVNFNKKDGDETDAVDFTSEEWDKIYEKLFGGFEDIENTDDEEEEDELANVPKKYLTKKGGYLKDGFVVDTTSEDDTYDSDDSKEGKSRKNTVIKIKQSDSINGEDIESTIDNADNTDDDDVSIDNNDIDNDNDEENEEIDEDVEEEDNEDDGNEEDDEEDEEQDDEDDDSYVVNSSDESENSSELSESAYCEYSDEL